MDDEAVDDDDKAGEAGDEDEVEDEGEAEKSAIVGGLEEQSKRGGVGMETPHFPHFRSVERGTVKKRKEIPFGFESEGETNTLHHTVRCSGLGAGCAIVQTSR